MTTTEFIDGIRVTYEKIPVRQILFNLLSDNEPLEDVLILARDFDGELRVYSSSGDEDTNDQLIDEYLNKWCSDDSYLDDLEVDE